MTVAGLRIHNASGLVTIDTTTSTHRVLGIVTTVSGVSDSVTDADLATGTPFALIVSGYGPAVSVSGTTVSWSYAGGRAGGGSVIIAYGVT